MKRTIVFLGLMILAGAARAATVGIAWDAVTTNADGTPITDLAGYEVYYATYTMTGMTTGQALITGTIAKQQVVGLTTATIAGLADATTYYIRLTAYDTSVNHSSWSVQSDGVTDLELSTCTPPPHPPLAPGTPVLTVLSATQIQFVWADNSDNETGFRIERSTNNFVTAGTAANVGANATASDSYTDTRLSASTLYYYRVVAKNAVGETASGVASATTQALPAAPPTTPTNLAPVAISSAQINVVWTDASNNEDWFAIERSLSQSGGFVQISTVGAVAGTGSQVTYLDATGLSAGTVYYYRVRAYNVAGFSIYTTVKSAQTTGGVTPQGSGSTSPGMAYAFPNPAVGKDPTIRAMMDADSAEITIFDASGQVVHTARVTQSTTVNGQTAFEYVWTGKKATGVYFAVIHGKKGGETIRARTKFAVVR